MVDSVDAFGTVDSVDQLDISTVIDSHGDVKLILDHGTLTVSRKALCLSSPVFLAMLDGDSQFREASGQALGKGQLRDIPLREDDFATMEIIMKIIHHQNHTVPTELSFQQLKKIAVVCDKYDLRNCLVPWSSLWSQPYLASVEKDGFESWLFIAVVFRNEAAFTRTTKHLILNTCLSSSGKLSSLSGINLEEGISDDIIRQIKDQRAATLEAVQDFIRKLMLRLLYPKLGPVCNLHEKRDQCDRLNLGCLLQAFPHLCDSNAKDDLSSTIASTVAKIRQVQNSGSELSFYQWQPPSGNKNHAACGLDMIILPEVTEITQAVQGLVLKTKPN